MVKRISPLELPDRPDPALLPALVAKPHLSAIYRQYFGPCTPTGRGFESWPEFQGCWTKLNGYAVLPTSIFLQVCTARVQAALERVESRAA